MRTPASGRDAVERPRLETSRWRDQWGRLTALLVAQYRRLDLAEDGLGRRLRGGRPHLAARRRPDQPAGLAAHQCPAPDPRPAPGRGGGRQEAAAARRRGRAPGGGAARDGRRRASRCATSGCGWCMLCAHPALRARERRRADAAAGARRAAPPTSHGCSWCRPPTMAARLTRARKSLAGERFEVPTGAELERAGRRGGRRRLPGLHRRLRARRRAPDVLRTDLAAEAIRLARLLRDLLPGRRRARRAARADAAPALAARRAARATARLVLLPDQDRSPLAPGRDRRGAGPAHAARGRAPARRTSCRR